MKDKKLLCAFFFTFIILRCAEFSFSQGEMNHWFFGNNAGLDFTSGVPEASTKGEINTSEGCSSMSDNNGELLFYTDGISVWNKNHSKMPNGHSLEGGHSSTQSAVIIKKPGNSSVYYIFTADQQYGVNGIKYSEVDLLMNNGLGDVINKNVSLYTPSCEKIAAVKHCNGRDVWIITHDWNSSSFRVFLVTSAGISNVPVISNAGLTITGNQNNKIGYLKASPDGTRLASAIWGTGINRFEVFNFNKSSGVVSNAILFPVIAATSGAYGVEFSPDGTKLYGSVLSPASVYQFDLCAGSDSAIAKSGILIGTSSALLSGALQLGPDNKIYLAKYLSDSLGIINDPDKTGIDCNFIDNGISLGGQLSSLGLPNFVTGNRIPDILPFYSLIKCDVGFFSLRSVKPSCANTDNPVISVNWNFGDPESGNDNFSTSLNPTHVFSGQGSYDVILTVYYACGFNSIRQNITVRHSISKLAVSDSSICLGENIVLCASGGINYVWSTGQNNSCINSSPETDTEYSVEVISEEGCKDTLKQRIHVLPKPDGFISGEKEICEGDQTTLIASGGNSYNWNTGETNSEIRISPFESTFYSVVVFNGFCVDTASITIDVKEAPEIIVNEPISGTTYTEFNIEGGELFHWYPVQGLSCVDCHDPVAAPDETITYCVTVTGRNGCSDSAHVTATISVIYIPNAFSPDDNSLNDLFKPKIANVHNYQFLIFNRWGDKIFQTSDPESGWNGYYKGNLCEADSYVYKINFVDDERKAFHEYSGNLTLIR
jgi:gliding motility-associated-like protein